MQPRIEAFLSARLHLAPQIVGDYIYFVSNLSGRLSLYRMVYGGSMPEPLLPPDIAMHNPELIGGKPFFVFPLLDKILIMLDCEGDERYQPMLIPIDGGFPEPAFGDALKNFRMHLSECVIEKNIAYFAGEALDKPVQTAFRATLRTGQVEKLAESEWGSFPVGTNQDHSKTFILDSYITGDSVLYLWEKGKLRLLFGKPMDQRQPDEKVPFTGIGQVPFTESGSVAFTPSGQSVLLTTSIFDDRYSLGVIDLAHPGKIEPVKVTGVVHTGMGEMTSFSHLKGAHYAVLFNIDGCSWLYEGVFNEEKRLLGLKHVIVGDGDLANGVLERYDYDKAGDRFVLSFSTATSPSQLYTVEARDRMTIVVHTEERLLGIPEDWLSPGEDASFKSFDGTQVSARLYLPAKGLGFTGPRPLVYYIHGGPQGQERPDFAWFSMPLIQFLTMRGFAVFTPNVRGSTGYGLTYTTQVDRDWGGNDRLDYVHAMTRVLPRDKRLDVKRAAVVGRSYGGYMTLILAGRHPELWSAACDMFGPYDLQTFMERMPETWKPYYRIALADPATREGRAFLAERSPKTYIQDLACPMLVLQGRNDPRVVARESDDLVSDLRKQGKQIELTVFEDEGHDVLKYSNRVTCYNLITEFFVKYLHP